AAPNSALARAFYGEALADVGRYDDAGAQLSKGAELAKKGTAYERAEIERNWANYYRDKKDYVQALNHLKLAAGAQPKWVERLLELARFSIGRQDLSAATQFLERAASLSPDDAGLREQLGDVALFAQDYGVAKSAYQAALKLQPRSPLDLKILGDIAVALDKDPTTAVKDERAAIAAKPTDQEAGAFLVAVLRYLQEDEPGALQAARQTVAAGGPSPAPAATYVDLDKAAADRQTVALATVNRYRRLAGLAPVTSSSVIQKSALAHAFYTFFNGALASIRDLGIHKEESTGQGYVGDNVLTRAQHFGYPQRSMAEVITHRADPVTATFDRNARVTITGFHFRDPSGKDLPGISLQPGTETENSFAFLANAPLQPGTTYGVDLTYTLNGVAGHATWHFTTAAGASPTPQTQQAADLR